MTDPTCTTVACTGAAWLHPGPSLPKRRAGAALCAAVLLALAGCGGGGGGGGDGTADPVAATVSGRVIDGYLVGAQVFWDCNDNFRIDEPSEPWVATTAGGRYTLAAAPNAACMLRAVVPSWTVDESSGVAVGRTYRMSALAGSPGVISPVTTLITDGKYTLQQVQSMTGFASAADVDYIAKGRDGIKDANIAGVIAVGLMAVDGEILAGDAQRRGLSHRNLVERMPADAYFVSTDALMPPNALKKLLDGLPDWTPPASAAPALELVMLDPARSGLCTDKLANGTTAAASDAVCEERKTFIRGALGLASRYRAGSGAAIKWEKIPLRERQALAAAEHIPANPAIDALRAEQAALTAKANADIAKAQGKFERAELVQIVSSSIDLTARAVDLGLTVREFTPAAKAGRLVSSKFKSLQTPIKLKKQARDFVKSSGRLKLKNYFESKAMVTAMGSCALRMGDEVLATWADAQDGPVDMPQEVVTYLVDISVCVLEMMSASAKPASGSDLAPREVFQKVVAASLGGIDFVSGAGDLTWSQTDLLAFWESVDDLMSLATLASDTLEVPGLSAALKLFQMYPGSMIATVKGNLGGQAHFAELLLALEVASRDLDVFLSDAGPRFFAGRVEAYIGIDVLLDVCNKSGATIGRAFAPVGVQGGVRQALAVKRTQAVSPGQRVQLGSALTLAPGQKFFGAGGVGRYTWDFGDGSAAVVTSTPDEVTHVYAQPGDYVVTLRTSSTGAPGADGSEAERYEASVYADIRVDAVSAEVRALVDGFSTAPATFLGMARSGADIYVASLVQQRASVLRNGDGTPFYLSSVQLTNIRDGAVQWHAPVASNLYMSDDTTQFSQTGIALARAGDAVLLAANGFVGGGYGMKFGVYRIGLSDRAVSYRALFAAANVGWYPWFSANDAVNHFAFGGYLRCLDAQCAGSIQPEAFVTESQARLLAGVGLVADARTDGTQFKPRFIAQLRNWLGL